MAKEGRDVISVCCMKNDVENVVSDADDMKNIWRRNMEKILNVENDWDDEVDCPEMMGPCYKLFLTGQQYCQLVAESFTLFIDSKNRDFLSFCVAFQIATYVTNIIP